MIKNIGSADQIIRIIIGVTIAGLGLYFKSWWGLVAIVPILTAFIRTCPLYIPFGMKTTCKK
jgi:hypothetical protein